MKKLFHRNGLVCWLLAQVSFILILHAATVEAGDESFSESWIRTWKDLLLPNGDKADAYFPDIPEFLRQYFTDAFPVVAILQGAQVDKMHYQNFGRRLARHGFVVVIPNHFRSVPTGPPPAPMFTGFFSGSSVVSNAIDQMKHEDGDPSSPLYKVVDTESVGLVGHSFGGVAGLYALADDGCEETPVPPFCDNPLTDPYTRPDGLTAAVFYGTNLVVPINPPPPPPTPQDFVINLDTSGVAVALMQGTLDGISLPEKADRTYTTIEDPRGLITINGANHYGICDVNNPGPPIPPPPGFFPPAPQPDFSKPTLSQSESVARVARWTGLWLRAQLKNDPIAKFWLYTLGGSLDEVVTVETD